MEVCVRSNRQRICVSRCWPPLVETVAAGRRPESLPAAACRSRRRPPSLLGPPSPPAAPAVWPICLCITLCAPLIYSRVAALCLTHLELHALGSAGLPLAQAWPAYGCAVPGYPGAARATLRWPAAGPSLAYLWLHGAWLSWSCTRCTPLACRWPEPGLPMAARCLAILELHALRFAGLPLARA